MQSPRDGIQHRMMRPQPEITVAPDRFEITSEDTVLVAELRSALAVCIYDAVEEAGALLHLRCVVRVSKASDMTDTTLATELLLLDRCIESMREVAPAARNLQARIFAHLDDHPMASAVCDAALTLVQHFLTDSGVTLLPVEIGSGPPRELRFRPSMGWVQAR
jgi:chemotaxis receptor (MCP) glutamine deamidase CheD